MRLPLPMSFGSLHMNVLPDGLSTRPKNLNLMRVFTMRIVRTAVDPPVFSLPGDKIMPASRTSGGNNSIMFLLLDGAYILDMTLFVFFGFFYLDREEFGIYIIYLFTGNAVFFELRYKTDEPVPINHIIVPKRHAQISSI